MPGIVVIAETSPFMDSLATGLMAVFLCLPAMIVWLFVFLLMGRVWRRLVKRKRERVMRSLMGCFVLITVVGFLAIPMTPDYKDLDPTDVYSEGWIESYRYGITSWLLHEFYTSPATGWKMVDNGFSINVTGLGTILPTILLLLLLGYKIGEWLPKMYRLPDKFCDECHYDLTGITSPVCPECGEVIT